MEAPDGGIAAAANSLRLIQLAMAGGIVMMGATVGYLYSTSQTPPGPAALANIRLFSEVNALAALLLFGGSPLVFRSILGSRPAIESVKSAVIARAAMREGSALLGLIVCLLAALCGILERHPVFWANALPSAAFVVWALGTPPTEDEIRSLLPPS